MNTYSDQSKDKSTSVHTHGFNHHKESQHSSTQMNKLPVLDYNEQLKDSTCDENHIFYYEFEMYELANILDFHQEEMIMLNIKNITNVIRNQQKMSDKMY